jgi:hypothetical protein
MCYCFRMSPTAKKLATDHVVRAFAEAEEGPTLSDDDRAALTEAAANPKWVRMSRGEAFERLVCDDDGG